MSLTRNSALLAVVLVLSACQNPHNAELPTDLTKIDQSTKDQLQKLTPDEREKVAKYAVRHTLTGGAIPEGTTVVKAIDEQNAFELAQAKKEAEAAALKASVEKQMAEETAKLNGAVQVALISKTFVPSSVERRQYRDEIDMKIAFSNKTDKAVAGVKGTMVFKDLFGDVIKRVRVSMTDEIKPNDVYIWDGVLDYNQFEDKDQKLAFEPTEKLKFEFEPDTIVFADGSQLSLLSIPPPPDRS